MTSQITWLIQAFNYLPKYPCLSYFLRVGHTVNPILSTLGTSFFYLKHVGGRVLASPTTHTRGVVTLRDCYVPQESNQINVIRRGPFSKARISIFTFSKAPRSSLNHLYSSTPEYHFFLWDTNGYSNTTKKGIILERCITFYTLH